MPEYKGTVEVTFTADDDEADVHLLECANASLVLSATVPNHRTDLGGSLIERRFAFGEQRP
jgi:hypothetical protein